MATRKATATGIVAGRRRGAAGLLVAILALSSFTHIWNPAGFPDVFYDEGVYMRRAMHILAGGGGVQEPGTYYDHPYFGQIMLAAVLWLAGYAPGDGSVLPPSADAASVAGLYAVPRVFMGILSVIDTLLIYGIAERRYGSRTAIIASALFAVMPFTWITRRVLLDSMMLPFILGSVFFAVRAADDNNNSGRKKHAFIILSGVLIGTAVFTKAPAALFAPFVGYLVIKAVAATAAGWRQKLAGLAAWLAPAAAIPALWPLVAAARGQLAYWQAGVLRQAGRSGDFPRFVQTFAAADPVLFALGSAGLAFAVARRDYALLLWAGPFLAFLASGVYLQYFHWMALLPVFCIAGGLLLGRVADYRPKVAWPAVAGILAFGLASTAMLVSLDLSSAQFAAVSYVLETTAGDDGENNTIVVSSPSYSWIFIHSGRDALLDYRDAMFRPLKAGKEVVLVVDGHFRDNMGESGKLQALYDSTATAATFEGKAREYDMNRYPYTSLRTPQDGRLVEVRMAR